MTPEPRTVTNAALDRLPLFATDLEIAIAIVGKQNASRWKRDVIPVLEHKGFPRFDPLHQGRPVPLIKQFYAIYFGITHGFTLAKPDGEERVWIPKGESKKIEDEQRRTAGAGIPRRDRRAEAKANAEAWKEKKRKALEDFRAKKAAEAAGLRQQD